MHWHTSNLALMLGLLLVGLLGLAGLIWLSPLAAGGVILLALGGGVVSMRALFRLARQTRQSSGLERFLDQPAVVTQTLTPEGRVRLHGEDWAAVLDEPFAHAPVAAGRNVRVVGVEHLRLIVAPTVQELLDHARDRLLADSTATPRQES